MIAAWNFYNLQAVMFKSKKSKVSTYGDLIIFNSSLCNLDFRTKSKNGKIEKTTSRAKINFNEVLLSSS